MVYCVLEMVLAKLLFTFLIWSTISFIFLIKQGWKALAMNYLFISSHKYTTFQTNLVVKHSIDQVRSGHVISTRYVIHCPI